MTKRRAIANDQHMVARMQAWWDQYFLDRQAKKKQKTWEREAPKKKNEAQVEKEDVKKNKLEKKDTKKNQQGDKKEEGAKAEEREKEAVKKKMKEENEKAKEKKSKEKEEPKEESEEKESLSEEETEEEEPEKEEESSSESSSDEEEKGDEDEKNDKDNWKGAKTDEESEKGSSSDDEEDEEEAKQGILKNTRTAAAGDSSEDEDAIDDDVKKKNSKKEKKDKKCEEEKKMGKKSKKEKKTEKDQKNKKDEKKAKKETDENKKRPCDGGEGGKKKKKKLEAAEQALAERRASKEGEEDEGGGKGDVNSVTHRAEWQAFGRYLKNKRRCPAKLAAAAQNEETRNKLFQTYIENNRSTDAVEAKFQAMLIESTKTSLRYGFRNDIWLRKHHGDRKAESIMKRKELGLFLSYMTIPDEPGELLYWVMVEFNLDDIKELRRAGGCLDGKQHLSIGELSGSKGMKTVHVDSPLEKAEALLGKVLKDINICQELALKLRPLSLSTDLIEQLEACAVTLSKQAEKLQSKIRHQCNKNKHYRQIISEVKDVSDIAKERCDLAKALIRASAKAAKPPVKRPSDKSDKADTAAKGAS
ncbi:Uncharacterized protein (Fragment) [Durusdinium trenchii]|uniref:Uncharacterized protein n=1 Tax=Durusdinium trenchii TaxID=1381693 RepID=A0ABP0KMI3_9DINO